MNRLAIPSNQAVLRTLLLSSRPMFLLTRPEVGQIEELLASERDQPFSYPEVGGSRVAAPRGYNVDHNRVQLGRGDEAFRAAVAALNDWKMFDMDWIELVPSHPPVRVGETVAVLVRHVGFWSVNVSRVVFTVDDTGDVKRYGFAYGTLPQHAEQGEERFTVEYTQNGDVWYDLYAFSKPRHALAKLGYPISRRLQKRFAQDSLKAMKNAVQNRLR